MPWALETARAATANPDMGERLSQSDREAMSAHFGYDFSRVRIHTNSSVARAVRARGFVNGQHIWFPPGRGPDDRALLVHELTHVVQQATGEADLLRGECEDLDRRDWLERRARGGNAQRPPITDGMAQFLPAPLRPAVIQFDFEEDALRELHRMPSAEEEGISHAEQKQRVQALAARGGRLFALFTALSRPQADEIYERLRTRRKGDALSESFHDMLSTALREDLLASIGVKYRRRVPILRLFDIPEFMPDPADFCKPFSKREIDQDLDFEYANAMDHFVNREMRDFWGDEAADLYDTYLTSTSKNVTPTIFKDPNSELVQSFINHEATAKRQRELAAIIEKNLPNNCGQLPPNEWVDFSSVAIISPAELNAPFSFSGFSTIPGIIAGGVSPGPGAPESRRLSIKQALIYRAQVMGGVTMGVRLRLQFHFVVQDSIDFCPGAMGGHLASHVTVPMGRLEASGMAFPVPFEVHYDGPVLEVQLGPDAIKACS
jgi:hypothetical protein